MNPLSLYPERFRSLLLLACGSLCAAGAGLSAADTTPPAATQPQPATAAPAPTGKQEAPAAATQPATPAAAAPAAGEKTAADAKRLITFPNTEIDLLNREIRVKATVSEELNWGTPLLEFALMNGKEKGYETLFLTNANPTHIQLGLVLLGLRPRALPKALMEHPGRPEKFPPEMPPLVEVLIRWDTEKGPKTIPLEQLLVQRKDDKSPQNLLFAFTGSEMTEYEGKQVLGAQLSGYILTVLYNPVSVLNLAWYEASPYNDQVSGYCIDINKLPTEMVTVKKMEINNKGMVDQIVTRPYPVTVIIRPLDTTKK